MQAFERIHPLEFQKRFLAQDTRHNGRAFLEPRPTQTLLGTIGTAQGSATVRLGNTTVVCGIKAEISEPTVGDPSKGFLTTNLELSPMCSARYRPGPPGEQAQVLSEHIWRLSRQLVDLEDLCVEKGRAVWSLTADVVCLKYDGGVLRASMEALAGALRDLRLPKAELDSTGVVVADKEVLSEVKVKKSLAVREFAVVEGCVVADADEAEEQWGQGTLVVAADDQGGLANVWKQGSGMDQEQIKQCIKSVLAS